jgi:hypothetical protein
MSRAKTCSRFPVSYRGINMNWQPACKIGESDIAVKICWFIFLDLNIKRRTFEMVVA